MNIGEAARAVGLPVKTVRYYDEITLVSPIERSRSGYREYSRTELSKLIFAKRARAFGFSIDETRELKALEKRVLSIGAEIERLGLANKVVPHDELLDEAMSWAEQLAANAPLAVAAAKRTMRLGLDSTFEANSWAVMAELNTLFRTHDFKEGVMSFMEKREAKYQGR